MIPANLLRRIRNDLPMPITIAALGNEAPPSKYSEGYFRFLCPNCGEMKATVNPKQQPRPLLLLRREPQQHRPLDPARLQLPLRRRPTGILAATLPKSTNPKEQSDPARRAYVAAWANPYRLNSATNAIRISTGTSNRVKSQFHRSPRPKTAPTNHPTLTFRPRPTIQSARCKSYQNHRAPPLQNSQQFGKTTLSKPKSLQR